MEFILKNNYFQFDDSFYHQLFGTAMGTIVAPSYACLVIGFLEQVKLFPVILPQYFTLTQCNTIKKFLKRYMDDGFIPLPLQIDINTFMVCLNSMHKDIIFTKEEALNHTYYGKKAKILNFLDVSVILTEDNIIETDIFYKSTNSHDYLNYNSHHPDHTKKNIPFTLAKRIICFVSNNTHMEKRLNELEDFLTKCNYPKNVITDGIFKAKLQGPAPKKNNDNIIPFVTTNFANINFDQTLSKIRFFMKQLDADSELCEIFKESTVLLSQRQPKNLLRHLSHSKFESIRNNNTENLIKISKCISKTKTCKICSQYLQFTNEFTTTTGKIWVTKCEMNCNSKNVIYYLKCNFCDTASYIGKTNDLRSRTNVHISSCRTGNGSDIFDQHVFKCRKNNNNEPYFKLYLMMKLKTDAALLTYESHFHSLGYDTFNK